MGKHVAAADEFAEHMAYVEAPGYYDGDHEPDYLNQRLTRGRNVATYPAGTAVGYFLNLEAWQKEKP